MALKDWKKVKHYENTWKKSHGIIDYNEQIIRVLFEKDYIVWLSTPGYTKTLKHFETKSQALKFAKSYMRKH